MNSDTVATTTMSRNNSETHIGLFKAIKSYSRCKLSHPQLTDWLHRARMSARSAFRVVNIVINRTLTLRVTAVLRVVTSALVTVWQIM